MPEYRTAIHPRGFLNRWLVVGPFPILLASGKAPDKAVRRMAQLGALGARTHPIPTDEQGRLDLDAPRPGDEVAFQGVRARWEPYDGGDDHTILLSERLRPAYNSIAYLYAQVELADDAAKLLHLRAERGAELWVDGRSRTMLYGDLSKIGALEAGARCYLNLEPGCHEIVVKCWQCRTVGMNGWGLQMQLLDAAGLPYDRGEVILPVRDASQERELAHRALAEKASVPLDVSADGSLRVQSPGLSQARRLRLRLPSCDLPIEADCGKPLGPIPQEVSDRVVSAKIDFLDGRGETLASVLRPFAVEATSTVPGDPKRAVLEAVAKRYGPEDRFNAASLVARYALGRPPQDPLAWLKPAFALIDDRYDCADFNMLWLLRWRYLFGHSDGAAELTAALDRRMLGFVYEPQDSDDHTMCMSTENHRAMFWTCELLAGQALSETVFSVTGKTGRWHLARAREHLLSWIHDKLRFGYAEWGCHYLMVDLDLLCCLRDFCRDGEVADLADRLACKTILLMVNDAFRGSQSGAQSRAYAQELLWPNVRRSAADVFALLGDDQAHPVGDSFSLGIATTTRPFPSWLAAGLNPRDDVLIRERQGTGRLTALRTMFRTPDAALASALCDPHSGHPQKLDWCASLGNWVKVFTTHPGPGNESHEHRPNYWSGTVVPPRLGQSRSALLCLYDIPAHDAWGYTHAFWPESRFDETLRADGWFFGRCGSGYVALRPLPEGRLVGEGRYADREILAHGKLTGYICQIGRGGRASGFVEFARTVGAAPVRFGPEGVAYESGSEGLLELFPDGCFRVNGREATWEEDLHIDSPWADSRWGEGIVHVHAPQG